MCEGGTRERKCSGNSHNAISSKQVASCPSFSRGTNASFFKCSNNPILTSLFSSVYFTHSAGFGNEHSYQDKHLQFGGLLHFPSIFPPPLSIFQFFPLSHFLHLLIYSIPFSLPPHHHHHNHHHHQLLFVLRTFEVALTSMKRNQTHFGLCLFAVYINESFMCCVYGGTR